MSKKLQILHCLIYIVLFYFIPPILAQNSNVIFTDQTDAAGIKFMHLNGMSDQKYLPETMGSGCLFIDFDNDGFLDIYLVNSGTTCSNINRSRTELNEINKLYRNNRNGTFSDITNKVGMDSNDGFGMGCISADYDNDGDQDLYLTNFGRNQLYRNNGDSTFTDVTKLAGVANAQWSVSASFGDYNLDGFLDLYVANYLDYNVETAHSCTLEGVHIYCGPHEYPGAPDTLYRNNGDGTFTDVTARSGVINSGKGLGVLFTDYNYDGYPDIFVTNDAVEDFLYRNNRDGTFTNVAVEAGIAYNSEGRATASMGIAHGDYDNDGALDLFVTNFSLEVNSLFHNDGDGYYTMTTFEVGLAEPSFSRLGFGTQFLDFDNNGTLDLLVANGHVWDNVTQITPTLSYKQSCQLFLNNGKGKYRDITNSAGTFFKRPVVARGTSSGDYDNDGDIDVLISCSGGTPVLLRNDTITKNRWLKIQLRGTTGNKDAIGTKVYLTTNKTTYLREVTSGGSYASGNDYTLHFGLGATETVSSINIHWLGGNVQHLENVSTELLLRINEN